MKKDKRIKVWNKYGKRCAYCGCELEYKEMQVDHITPKLQFELNGGDGVNVLRIGRFSPSSKTCECGKINKDLKLSDRTWECECGKVMERDLNAARNIKNFALKDNSGQELSVEPVEMSALVESTKQEAHQSLVDG